MCILLYSRNKGIVHLNKPIQIDCAVVYALFDLLDKNYNRVRIGKDGNLVTINEHGYMV